MKIEVKIECVAGKTPVRTTIIIDGQPQTHEGIHRLMTNSRCDNSGLFGTGDSFFRVSDNGPMSVYVDFIGEFSPNILTAENYLKELISRAKKVNDAFLAKYPQRDDYAVVEF